MRTRYGWDPTSWYGQFAMVGSGVLTLALAGLVAANLLVLRYQARLAAGEIDPPALRALQDGPPVFVLGASVGDIPGAGHVGVLRAALQQSVKGLPWQRVLLHRDGGKGAAALTALFFPVNGVAEAFALCRKLAGIPPRCAPTIVAVSELYDLRGQPMSEAGLSRLGIAPYEPPRGRTHLATAAPRRAVRRPAVASRSPPEQVARINMQPPLALQPGVPLAQPDRAAKRFWLSAVYPPGSAKLVDVVAAGDVMMGSIGAGLNPAIRPGTDAARLVGPGLAGIFRRADVAFANLEGPLYDGPEPSPKDCSNCFAFHSPPYYAGVLRSLGLDVVSLANNHSGDYGEAGRRATMAALRAQGIAFGGLDRNGARAATLVLPDGRKVAVTAFAPNNGTLNLNNLTAARSLIRALHKTHDLVVVSFHGGAEGWSHVHVPKTEEYYYGEDRGNVERFAHAAIDAGADLVIGQGPHVPRAVEIYRGHLIAYSLGNFWTYEGVNTYAVSGLGPVLEAWLAPDGTIAGFTLHSTRQAGLGVPHLDPLQEAERYTLYLTRSDFPGTARRLRHLGRAMAQRGEGGEEPGLAGPGS